MSNIIVLGIAGGSGSGKTTLMKNLDRPLSGRGHRAQPR